MSEQEAEALTARLRRIWAPQVCQLAHHPTHDGMLWMHGQILEGRGRFSFCRDIVGRSERVLLTRHSDQNSENGRLDWNSPDKSLRFHSYFYNGDDTNEKEKAFVEFAAEWMAFFRCSCWLSGCEVEASAQEKAEWMRGFTREEVEAWDLKF